MTRIEYPKQQNCEKTQVHANGCISVSLIDHRSPGWAGYLGSAAGCACVIRPWSGSYITEHPLSSSSRLFVLPAPTALEFGSLGRPAGTSSLHSKDIYTGDSTLTRKICSNRPNQRCVNCVKMNPKMQRVLRRNRRLQQREPGRQRGECK
jgi:hypothetical protein